VTVTAEPRNVKVPEVAPIVTPLGSIHIEFPSRALVSAANGVDLALMRAVPGSLLR
jgi:hypothetical protein